MVAPYKDPEFLSKAFNCPFCGAYSNQQWYQLQYTPYAKQNLVGGHSAFCSCCGRYSIWFDRKMIFPDHLNVVEANCDLSDDIRADYDEAASILQKSPRGSAALLRLAIQKLCLELGEKGDIDKMVGNLVKKGLPETVQKALDTVRVIGNEAVHPGALDLKDDIATASKLFKLVNFIAEKMISEPNEINDLFDDKVPEPKKQAIEIRDATQ